jgi:hypothetical protein
VALLQSAPVERDSICFSPLSGAKGIPSDLPNCRGVRQADRRCVISTFQVAESRGFKGDFRQWEHLLRIGELRPTMPIDMQLTSRIAPFVDLVLRVDRA